MYAKLIFRNAKRSAKDYLIYIVTLTICVTLFYAELFICPAARLLHGKANPLHTGIKVITCFSLDRSYPSSQQRQKQ